MVASIQDGEIRESASLLELLREQPARDALGLGFVIGRGNDANQLAQAPLAPQFLLVQLYIVGDQRVCRAPDAHVGAIILLELDDLERIEIAWQLLQVLDRRAAPA